MKFDKTISPDDHMVTASLEAYFKTTLSAAESIVRGLAANGQKAEDITCAMDFGCGYGRVYRAFPVLFPGAELMAVDLMDGAVKFCSETFGGVGVRSNEKFELDLPKLYDVCWLGSVFTHLPLSGWERLLKLLADNCKKGGSTIFTVHGSRGIEHIETVVLKRNPYLIDAEYFADMKVNLPSQGFSFTANKGGNHRHQVKMGMDVSEGTYGFSFTTKKWVEDFLSGSEEWNLMSYEPAGWGNNHDVVTVRRK